MKSHLRITIQTLLASGVSHREIERRTGVDRKTIRGQARAANSPGVATGSEGKTHGHFTALHRGQLHSNFTGNFTGVRPCLLPPQL